MTSGSLIAGERHEVRRKTGKKALRKVQEGSREWV